WGRLGAGGAGPADLAHLVALGLARLAELVDELVELLGLGFRDAVLLAEAELREHLRVAAEDDVRAATGHVRRDRDRALAPGLRDDVGLVLVVLGVEHRVLDLLLREDARDGAALLDARRTDQDGLAERVLLEDLVDDRGELL